MKGGKRNFAYSQKSAKSGIGFNNMYKNALQEIRVVSRRAGSVRFLDAKVVSFNCSWGANPGPPEGRPIVTKLSISTKFKRKGSTR